MKRKVRVRFAPSPTGFLHVGGIRTALYNYLFAKKHQGDFILRIEDTDSKRLVPGTEKYIIDSFKWLGIVFDEGPHCMGEYAPYRQSERKQLYKKYINQLLKKELAYIAFDTIDELADKRKNIPNFQYDSTTRMGMKNSLTLPQEEVLKKIKAGESCVIRIKIEPKQIITVKDLIHGEINIHTITLDDKVIYKLSDGLPTYHLANVIDDHLMKITHVIRGQEWLPSTPLHIVLYNYFGWGNDIPAFAHLPLLLKPDGNGKLSKRDGDKLGFPIFPLQLESHITKKHIDGYKEEGYLPEALINSLALLGWSPGENREILSINQLISMFSLEKCNKSGSKFNHNKIKWFNHKYIQKKSDQEITNLFLNFYNSNLEIKNFKNLIKVIEIVKTRIYLLKDLQNKFDFFFTTPKNYDQKMINPQFTKNICIQLNELTEILKIIPDFFAYSIELKIHQWISEKAYHFGSVMNAIRLSLVGTAKGPCIFHIIEIIGKEETILRIKKAIQILSKK